MFRPIKQENSLPPGVKKLLELIAERYRKKVPRWWEFWKKPPAPPPQLLGMTEIMAILKQRPTPMDRYRLDDGTDILEPALERPSGMSYSERRAQLNELHSGYTRYSTVEKIQ